MKLNKQGIEWPTAIVLRFGTILIVLAQLNLSFNSKILIGVALFVLALIAGDIARGLLALFSSLGIITIFQILIEELFPGLRLSLTFHSVLIIFGALTILFCANPKKLTTPLAFHLVVFEFLSLTLSTFLFRELKVSGGANHLALLAPEDNILWVFRARELITSDQITGVASDGGGHTFSHVLALVAQLKNFNVLPNWSLLSALETVVITYQLLGIIGLLFLGHFTLHLMKNFKTSGIVCALCSQILGFKLLHPLISTEGHLSLLMAIVFCWVFVFVAYNRSSRSSGVDLVVSISIVSLIAGSWWPLAPISVITVGILLYEHFRSRVHAPSWVLFFVPVIGVVITSTALFPRYKFLFQTLDIRNFLLAGGSFVESPALMTFVAIWSLYLFYTTERMSTDQSQSKQLVLGLMGALLTYGILLSQLTYFVGPNFAQSNYSAGKLLYAGVSVVLPLAIPVGSLKLHSQSRVSVGVVSLILLSVFSSVFFGNNVLNGRFNTVEPKWAKAFLEESVNSPDAIIVCNSDNDIAAYQCTKTARYLMTPNDRGGFQYAWEQFQIAPNDSTSLSDALKTTLKEDPMIQIIVISLEPQLTVQDIDRFQMELLPWPKFRIIDAQSGNQIQYPFSVIP